MARSDTDAVTARTPIPSFQQISVPLEIPSGSKIWGTAVGSIRNHHVELTGIDVSVIIEGVDAHHASDEGPGDNSTRAGE